MSQCFNPWEGGQLCVAKYELTACQKLFRVKKIVLIQAVVGIVSNDGLTASLV